MANLTHCILGGTFTYVHRGHLALFSACKKYGRVTIGLTSDEFVHRHKIYPSFSYRKRLAALKRALSREKLLSRATIVEIGTEEGVAIASDADTIIVSEETAPVAERINRIRHMHGRSRLAIEIVPLAFGQSLKKISAYDIFHRKCDLEGRLRKPVIIQAGTDNPTKLAGASAALGRIYKKRFRLRGHEEDSRVNAHPFNAETFAGASNRARAAWARARQMCDYSLGIESGLFTLAPGVHVDITVACVYDGKRETFGTGMGFVVPEWAAHKIRAHGSDLSKVMQEIMGDENIGRKQGALGWFSSGLMHRREQVEAAAKCAFVPRIAEAKKGIRY